MIIADEGKILICAIYKMKMEILTKTIAKDKTDLDSLTSATAWIFSIDSAQILKHLHRTEKASRLFNGSTATAQEVFLALSTLVSVDKAEKYKKWRGLIPGFVGHVLFMKPGEKLEYKNMVTNVQKETVNEYVDGLVRRDMWFTKAGRRFLFDLYSAEIQDRNLGRIRNMLLTFDGVQFVPMPKMREKIIERMQNGLQNGESKYKAKLLLKFMRGENYEPSANTRPN